MTKVQKSELKRLIAETRQLMAQLDAALKTPVKMVKPIEKWE